MFSPSTLPRKLWEHPNPQSTQMWAFKNSLEEQKGLSFAVCIPLFCGVQICSNFHRPMTLSTSGPSTTEQRSGTLPGTTSALFTKAATRQSSTRQLALTAFLTGSMESAPTSPRTCFSPRRNQPAATRRSPPSTRKTARLL